MSEFVRVVSEDECVPLAPVQPALVTGYEPDRFQKFAIAAIEAGENVLVTAKTGSGKTFVGEYQIAKSLSRGGRIFYTTPIKSLSNQKFHDLKKLFPEASVGIMTGDIKFRPDAQILVMTTEILRNLLFKRGTATESVGATALLSMDRLDAVVFDEVHYINDPDRGHVWEETLMLLPAEIKLILLSATLSQPIGFARWLGESKKKRVWLISTLWRAVPLEHCVIEDGRSLVIYDSAEQFHGETYSAWLRGREGAVAAHDKFKEKVRALRISGEGPVSGKTRPKAFEHVMNECLGDLEKRGCLPAIVFVFSRMGCERLAAKASGNFLDSSDSAAVAHIWDFHLSRYSSVLEKSPQNHTLRELALRGIAFHHSGLLPFLKEILEILFSKGLVKVLFATETFAVGINMPTKTVIFTAVDKFCEGGIRPLKSSEYIQMAGRAGRRGKDDRGLVIYLPQREPADLFTMRQVVTGKSASFCSRMNFHYDFVFKILNGGRTAAELIEGSYWWTLEKEEKANREKELSELEKKAASAWEHLTTEQRAVCEYRASIEDRIATTQNAKRKAALRELVAWKDEYRESIWNPLLDRYNSAKMIQTELTDLRKKCIEVSVVESVPSIQCRIRVLEECGYVEGSGSDFLTKAGILASEINEGHPFLMTELFLRLRGRSYGAKDLLTVLATFLGEREDSEGNKPLSDLAVSPTVQEELVRIGDDAQKFLSIEKKLGLDDIDYWTLSTEWIEPIGRWVEGEETVASLAAYFGIFEGNIQKALMKLSGLLEEFQALASLSGEVEWLKELEDARRLVLRDTIIAESLYLRI